MRERLVSYLLGELSPADAASVEAEVDADPKLKEQLEQLRACLCAEGGESCEELPDGLADRTADSVHDLVLGLEGGGAAGSDGARLATIRDTGVDAPTGSSRFTLVDGAVAVGVVLALGMMLLPALQECRESSRRIACKDNLRFLGQSLQQYATSHGNLYPHVQPGQPAGIYSVRLADSGLVDRQELADRLVCAGAPLADEVARGKVTIKVPSMGELASIDRAALDTLRRLLGGDYAYRLGYFDGPLYRPVAMSYNSGSPIMADAPTLVDGKWQSRNHGGCGQNVLFQDGHVSYRRSCLLPTVDDDFFLNTAGVAAAGTAWNDAVLVRSEVTPGVFPKRSTAGVRVIFTVKPRPATKAGAR